MIYILLIVNIYRGHEAAEFAHFAFIIFFLIILAIKFIEVTIAAYILFVALGVSIGILLLL